MCLILLSAPLRPSPPSRQQLPLVSLAEKECKVAVLRNPSTVLEANKLLSQCSGLDSLKCSGLGFWAPLRVVGTTVPKVSGG